MDREALQAATGWRIHHHDEVASTNDLALLLVERGAGPRTAVVADRQSAGRGRQGRAFASPAGGLYVSVVLDPADHSVPAGVVAWAAVAAAEAVESLVPVRTQLKWPNDLWIQRRKVGGILAERKDGLRHVVVGIGINLDAVPADLPPAVRGTTSALAQEGGGRVERDALLARLLSRLDAWSAGGAARTGPTALETAWRERLALMGEPIRYHLGGRECEGVLEDAALEDGLLIRDPLSGPVWRRAGHVQDLRPAGRAIS